VTGVLNAVVRLPEPGALVGTGYGLLIIGKSVCVLGLAAFGWHARRRLLAPSRRARLAPWLAAEVTLMVFTLGLAASLPSLSPG
jgi:putative copper resistance protein D